MNLSDLGEIALAWFRSANPTPEQEALAQERLNICNMCDEHVLVTRLQLHICDACGCPIHKKIFSPKAGPVACPKGKWIR